MNIIINGFFAKRFTPLIEEIIKLPTMSSIILFRDYQRHPQSVLSSNYEKQIQIIQVEKASDGQYEENDLIPLDNELLNNLAQCESIALKMMDRHADIPEYWKRKKLYLKHVRYWNHIFQTRKIDLFIGSNLPHEVYDYILYSISVHYGVKTLFFHQAAKFPNTAYVVDNMSTFMPSVADWKKHGDVVLSSEMSSFLRKETSSQSVPFYMKKERSSKEYIRKIKKYFLRKNAFARLMSRLKDEFIRPFTYGKLQRQYKRYAVTPDLNQKYIYVPLHYQPELTTSPLAHHFVHQELMVDILSYSIKNTDIKLYVKEHAKQTLKGRDFSFYNRLVQNENVYLIEKTTNTFELIENCMAVATCTGTAALEATVKLKPVLLFGSFVYMHAPGALKIDTVVDAMNAIKKVVSHEINISYDDVKKYLNMIEKNSVKATVNTEYDTGFVIDNEKNTKNLLKIIRNAVDESS